jgi:twitching motility protein PilT
MADKKTVVPLLGRLAVQMKLIDQQQLAQALQGLGPEGPKRLGATLVEMGMINDQQLTKLEAVQKDLIAKHQAKKAAAAKEAPPPQGAAAAEPVRERPLPPSSPAPAAAAPAAPAETEGSGLELASEPEPAPTPAAAPSVAPAAPSAPVEMPVCDTSATPATPATESAPSLELQLGPPTDAHFQRLGQLLRDAVQSGASDIHVHAGATPKQRINGTLEAMSPTPLAIDEAELLVASAISAEQRVELSCTGELDFCLELPGIGRFRANCYRQQRGFDAVFRSIDPEPPTLESLGLPEELTRFTEYHQGMVLITGPAGCGKSATMAALVNLINETREEHILTIEDPIEVIHRSKRCLVNQRHAGKDTESFARALRGALREDPDIIVIGELRDLETISLAMTAAETGHFVLATLHTNNAVRTINRMIGAFPSAEQGQVRTMLSESLRAVVSQRLVPRKDGNGRVPALEVLVLNRAISNLVREEKTVQIKSAIQTGRGQGMYLLEQSLQDLVKSGVVEKEVALRFAEEKKMITG